MKMREVLGQGIAAGVAAGLVAQLLSPRSSSSSSISGEPAQGKPSGRTLEPGKYWGDIVSDAPAIVELLRAGTSGGFGGSEYVRKVSAWLGNRGGNVRVEVVEPTHLSALLGDKRLIFVTFDLREPARITSADAAGLGFVPERYKGTLAQITSEDVVRAPHIPSSAEELVQYFDSITAGASSVGSAIKWAALGSVAYVAFQFVRARKS